ncbi:hypothetical protein BDN71DRAFT_1453375, partial [Pleurotus eryngii]
TSSWSLSSSVALVVRVGIENAAVLMRSEREEESRGQAALASPYPAALLSPVVTHGGDTERKTTEGGVAPSRTRTNSTWSIELCSVPLIRASI